MFQQLNSAFSRLKLRGQILAGYSIPLLIAACVAIGVTSVALEINNRFRRLNQSQQVYDEILNLNYLIGQADTNVSLALVYKTIQQQSVTNPTNLKLKETEKKVRPKFIYYLGEYKKFADQIKTSGDKLGKIIVEEDRRESYSKEVLPNLDLSYVVYNTTIDLINNNKPIEAALYWDGEEAVKSVSDLSAIKKKFEDGQKKIVDEQISQLQNLLTALILGVVIAAIASLIISIVIGLKIAGSITSSVTETVNQVSKTSDEIAVSLAVQEEVIVQQAASVNQTTTTMEELGASSRQSAEQANASAAGAKRALELSNSGTEAVQSTLQGIGGLRESVGAIAEKIMQLSEQTAQISTVSELVADIANQTNILALNAAVEAARAGEQGKGFSVVAQEVRKLADESRKSAEKISVLIREIQASINSTVMVTDQGTKTATESIRLAQSTAASFQSIVDAINTIFMNTQQIALSSKQQAVGVQQVVSAMNAINLGAQEAATSVTEIKTATEHLSESTEVLKNKV